MIGTAIILSLMLLTLFSATVLQLGFYTQAMRRCLHSLESFYSAEIASWHAYQRDGSGIAVARGVIARAPLSTTYDSDPDGIPTQKYEVDDPEGTPYYVPITQLFDSGKSLVRRYDGQNLTYQVSLEDSSELFCGTIQYDPKFKFHTCLISLDSSVDDPPTCLLTAAPSSVPAGGTSTLTLVSSGSVTTASINETPVAPAGGSIAVSVFVDTTYTGTVSGPDGISTCNTTVQIENPCEAPSLIDFELLPDGTRPKEGLVIDDQYWMSHGVRFKRENGGFPQIAQVGSPLTGWRCKQSGCSDSEDGVRGEGAEQIGQYALTDDGEVKSNAQVVIVEYANPVSQASGILIDIDGGDEWLVEGLDSSSNVIDSWNFRSNDSTYSGKGVLWSLSASLPTIVSIRMERVSPDTKNEGFGFDRFSPNRICPLDPAPTLACTLAATPSAVGTGESSTLTLSTSGVVTSATIEGTSVSPSGGTKVVLPTATTTYSATVIGPSDTATCQATVNLGYRIPDALTFVYINSQGAGEKDWFGVMADTASSTGIMRSHCTHCNDAKSRSNHEGLHYIRLFFDVGGTVYELGDLIPTSPPTQPVMGLLQMEKLDDRRILQAAQTIDIRRYFGEGTSVNFRNTYPLLFGVKDARARYEPAIVHKLHFGPPDPINNPYGMFDEWSQCKGCDCTDDPNKVGSKWDCTDPTVLCPRD